VLLPATPAAACAAACCRAPAGIYPFAGKEVARAFALISTDVKDCSADLSGLGPVELDALREWEAKFNSKYPIVGRLVGDS
jgi:membrane-associated progesterone receptor component